VYGGLEDESPAQTIKRKLRVLEERSAAHRRLIELLRFRDEQSVALILHRIRAGDPVDSVISLVQDGDLLLQLALAPPSEYRYEFPYAKDMPAFLLGRPDNPYLDSWAFRLPPRDRLGSAPPGHSGDAGAEVRKMYSIPFHAAQLVDARLESVSASRWTNVPCSDKLFRELLQIYLLWDYHHFGIFQKDYLLDDMVAGKEQFCSPLLVNAILATASVGTSSAILHSGAEVDSLTARSPVQPETM
jgi:hypothetical protein